MRPTITSRKRNEITVHEGELLYLECEAKGVPAPLVIWRKNGTIIQERTNRTYFKHDNATADDGGMYKCEASNSAGNDSYMVVVKIKPVKGNLFKYRKAQWAFLPAVLSHPTSRLTNVSATPCSFKLS